MSEATAELVDRLRVWSRRYEVHSNERRLMLEAAATIEGLSAAPPAPPPHGLTVEMIEAALGGAKLLPWQVAKLPPPSSPGR